MSSRLARTLTGLVLAGLLLVVWTRPYLRAIPYADSLPLLAGAVFAWWIGRPWCAQERDEKAPAGLLVAGLLVFVAGLIGQLLVLLAAGWSLLLYAWVSHYWGRPRYGPQWLLLVFFSFPWLAVDFSALGWWFRLTGARVTEWFFGGLGFSILRDGTMLNLHGLPIAIEPACAGMNLLPALLLAGTAVGLLALGGTNRFWFFLLLLPALAWLANTVRIVVISAVALTWGATFASGFFHTWGALLVLGAMFCGCLVLARVFQTKTAAALHE